MQNDKLSGVGVWPAVLVGMAERFSFYGLRSVLFMLLVYGADAENPGLGWERDQALSFYGNFISIFAVSILLAGFLIDTVLTARKALLLGSALFGAGLFVLSVMAGLGGSTSALYVGLALVVVGSSLVRPAVLLAIADNYAGKESGLAAALYGYQWIAISVAAFLAPLVVGTFSESYGWYVGLAVAAGVAFSAATLIGVAKPTSIEVVQPPVSRPQLPAWLVVVIPVFLSLLSGFSSDLVDSRVNAVFSTTEMMSVGDYTFPVRALQALGIVLSPVFAIAILLLLRRRMMNLLPMGKLMVCSIAFYLISALIMFWRKEYSESIETVYWAVLVLILALMAELLLFVPLLTKIVGASFFRFRATAVAAYLSLSIAGSAWLIKWMADTSSTASWLWMVAGFVLTIVIGLLCYGWRRPMAN